MTKVLDLLNRFSQQIFQEMYGDLSGELVGGRFNDHICSELMQDRKKITSLNCSVW